MARLRVLAVTSAVGLVLVVVFADAPARWLNVVDPLQSADAALVMTGDPGFERTKSASALVRDGVARLLVLTGGEPWGGDSAASLRDKALDLGVPAERIRFEDASTDTRESLVAVEPILRRENVRTLILVTSPYHQRRAFLAARRALPGIRIINRPSPALGWKPEGWWRRRHTREIVLSEYGKLLYYATHGWI